MLPNSYESSLASVANQTGVQENILQETDSQKGALLNWQAAKWPTADVLELHDESLFLGHEQLSLDRMQSSHITALWDTICSEPNEACWAYLPYGPFNNLTSFTGCIAQLLEQPNLVPYTIFKDRVAVGWIALMAIRPEHGVIEVGHIYYSHLLRRNQFGTLAFFLCLNIFRY